MNSFKFNKVTVLLILCTLCSASFSQISEYENCSEYDQKLSEFERPLSEEEKIKQLDTAFYKRMSDITKCEDLSSPSTAQGSSGSRSGSSVAAGYNSLSNNILKAGQASMPVGSESMRNENSESKTIKINDLNNGRMHSKLKDVDNIETLKTQIKVEAEKETNPEIKKALLEQYEALK